MTIVTVLLIGAGTLLISSALDCTPIVATFQKIISGQSIDYSGTQNCTSSLGTATPGGDIYGPGLQPTNPDGSCPAGCTRVIVSGGHFACQCSAQNS